MAPSQRTRRLAIGVVSLVAVALVVLGIAVAMSPRARLLRHSRNGDALLAAGRYSEAALAFRAVLQIAPQAARAHYKLGLAYLRIGEVNLSYRELTRSLELDSTLLDARLKLGEIFLLPPAQYPQARDQAQLVLGRDPSNADARLLLAQSLEGQGDLDGALREVTQALGAAPTSGRAYVVLAGIRMARAEAALAEQALRQGVVAAPADPEPRVALATFFQRQGRRDAAEQVLKDAARALPRLLEPHLALGDLYVDWARTGDASVQYRAAQEVAPRSPAPGLKIADLLLAQGKPDEAKAAVEKVLAQSPLDSTAHFIRGKIYLAKGDAQVAIEEFQTVIRARPGHALARYLLARAYVGRGDVPSAKEQLDQVLKLDPRFVDARLALAQLQARSGDPKAAEQELRELVTLAPNSPTAYLLLGDFLVSQKAFSQAIDIYQHAVALNGRDPVIHLHLGLADRAAGRVDDAFHELEAALALQPDLVDALGAEVGIYLQKQDLISAIHRVEAQVARSPKSALLYVLLGSVYGAAGWDTKAEEAYYRAIATNPNEVAPYLLLGDLYAKKRVYEMATQKYEEALRLSPRFLPLYEILGTISERQGNVARAREYYERALKVDPNFAPAANNLAWSYAEHGGDLDKALSLAQAARKRLPRDPHVADTLGWLYYKKGLVKQAFPLLEESGQGLTTDPVVHYHLGLAYDRLGRSEMAKRELHKALDLKQEFEGIDDARRTLARLGD